MAGAVRVTVDQARIAVTAQEFRDCNTVHIHDIAALALLCAFASHAQLRN